MSSQALRKAVVERDDLVCQECGVGLILDEHAEGMTAHARLEEHRHVENLLDLGLYELVDDPEEVPGRDA